MRGKSLSWERDGADWPNREASQLVRSGGVRWHVQILGTGPVLLLLHGIGASTHSFRDLAPLLGRHFTVVVPDLPGHAFSGHHSVEQLTLPGMASALAELLRTLGVVPSGLVGHSAGAAIACRMTLDGLVRPNLIVSINGALLPFRGGAAFLFPRVARVLARSPFAVRALCWRARERTTVERLIQSTGSFLTPDGVRLYQRLLRSPAHVHAVVTMMAHWDLTALTRDFSRLSTETVLLVGHRDRAVSPGHALHVQHLIPHARIRTLRGWGHLCHEEAPAEVARHVRQAWENRAKSGASPSSGK